MQLGRRELERDADDDDDDDGGDGDEASASLRETEREIVMSFSRGVWGRIRTRDQSALLPTYLLYEAMIFFFLFFSFFPVANSIGML
jgi:hypothetical protein